MTLALDLTGTSGANLITDEEPNLLVNKSILVPANGPFYEKGLQIKFTPTGNTDAINLTLDLDYKIVYLLPNIAADGTNQIYGGIYLLSGILPGEYLVTYQALGGNVTLDLAQIIMFNSVLNTDSHFSGLIPSERYFVNKPTIFTIADFNNLLGKLPIAPAADKLYLGVKNLPNSLNVIGNAAAAAASTAASNSAKETGGNLDMITAQLTAMSTPVVRKPTYKTYTTTFTTDANLTEVSIINLTKLGPDGNGGMVAIDTNGNKIVGDVTVGTEVISPGEAINWSSGFNSVLDVITINVPTGATIGVVSVN